MTMKQVDDVARDRRMVAIVIVKDMTDEGDQSE